MRQIYRKFTPDSGLTVGISRQGLHIAEVTDVDGMIDNPETRWVQTSTRPI